MEYATDRNIGKAQQVGRTGSQKTCLIKGAVSPWTRAAVNETRTQQGIPASMNIGPGIFFSDLTAPKGERNEKLEVL